jgi:carbon storage regulator
MESGQMGMLVLTREADEVVMIGDDIEVMVVEVKGGRAKLGFTAPEGVKIHRLEIWLKIKELEAANGKAGRNEGDGADIDPASDRLAG